MSAALQALGRDFESVTYYGDAPWDERACRELGWRFQPVGARLQGIREYSADSVPDVWPGFGAGAVLGQGR